MFLDLSRLTDCLAYTFGAGENEIAHVAEKVCSSHSVIADVGSNIGTAALVFALYASEGVVYAFEPAESIRKALQRNILINRLSNVKIHAIGLGDRACSGRLELAMVGNPGSAYFVEDQTSSEVEIRTLDEALGCIERLDLLKVDVEGLEYEDFSGGLHTIQRCLPVIVFEANRIALRRYNHSIEQIIGLLSEIGYEFFTLEKGKFVKYQSSVYPGIHNVIAAHPKGWHPSCLGSL